VPRFTFLDVSTSAFNVLATVVMYAFHNPLLSLGAGASGTTIGAVAAVSVALESVASSPVVTISAEPESTVTTGFTEVVFAGAAAAVFAASSAGALRAVSIFEAKVVSFTDHGAGFVFQFSAKERFFQGLSVRKNGTCQQQKQYCLFHRCIAVYLQGSTQMCYRLPK
jgi:hypothetical protein